MTSLAFNAAHAQRLNVQLSSAIDSTVEGSVVPGDDFFGYANGRWSAAAHIPDGRERWGAREEIAERTRIQLTGLLDDAERAEQGTLARLVADFRAAYADGAAIEARALTTLRAPFDSIDHVGDRAALVRLLGNELRADVDPLDWGVYRSAGVLGLAVEHGIHGETGYAPFLVQGGLGLGDRSRYLDTTAAARTLLTRYTAYVAHQLSLAGFDDPGGRAAGVVALESALARTHASAEASAVDRNADSVWTREDFARRAPGIDWSAYFDAARLGDQHSFVVWQPSAIVGLATLVADRPLDVWKDYLRFHAIEIRADLLPRAFTDSALVVRGPPPGRDALAVAATTTMLSDAVDRLYAERWFAPEQKARVQAIVARVKDAFAQRVSKADWMTPAARAHALAKVRRLYIGVGYPDRWQSYADLSIRRDDPIGNVERIAERSYRQALRRLTQPFEVTEWLMPAHTPGALLVFQQNSYDFSAALLQPPKFDPLASDAAAYGAIGAIIGHDITHYVDVLGADYDSTGAMRRWWTGQDSARFDALARPLVEQFSAYRPFPDASVNGALTRTENVADLGGLVAAFDAYRRSLGAAAADPERRRALDREFFIAFAQSWRSRETDAALRARVATNDHAPDRYRVATVRNLDAWYDAFDVRPGQKLYLPPAARVHVW